MLCFKNDGEMAVKAAMTMGVSAKEGENPFGQFGSGVKYAIAILLRTGHSVNIYSGVDKYEFGLSDMVFRDKEFQVVTLNGEDLGFTTHLGAHWELWQAYRELLCNAMDEPGFEVSTTVTHTQRNTTTIVIEGKGIDEVHMNRGKYFLFDEAPTYTFGGAEIYQHRKNNGIFYQGVLVHTPNGHMRQSYNLLNPIVLTEDRTLRYEFQALDTIGAALLSCDDVDAIESMLLRQIDGHFEDNIEPRGRAEDMSKPFEQWALKAVDNPRIYLTSGTKRQLKRMGIERQQKLYDPTPLEIKMYDKAIAFLSNIGFEVEFPVTFVDDLGTGVHAQALMKEQRILVARECFTQGTRYVASTMLEEVLHLATGFGDETRELQTRLFDTIIKMGEQISGEPL